MRFCVRFYDGARTTDKMFADIASAYEFFKAKNDAGLSVAMYNMM